mmetsp:Transcript_140728/g.448866  ORF Transcript_140728/g.448866 Transcript_140728/m.448866 type:complete len:366 (-) Transcript_140728:135-1232(-)
MTSPSSSTGLQTTPQPGHCLSWRSPCISRKRSNFSKSASSVRSRTSSTAAAAHSRPPTGQTMALTLPSAINPRIQCLRHFLQQPWSSSPQSSNTTFSSPRAFSQQIGHRNVGSLPPATCKSEVVVCLNKLSVPSVAARTMPFDAEVLRATGKMGCECTLRVSENPSSVDDLLVALPALGLPPVRFPDPCLLPPASAADVAACEDRGDGDGAGNCSFGGCCCCCCCFCCCDAVAGEATAAILVTVRWPCTCWARNCAGNCGGRADVNAPAGSSAVGAGAADGTAGGTTAPGCNIGCPKPPPNKHPPPGAPSAGMPCMTTRTPEGNATGPAAQRPAAKAAPATPGCAQGARATAAGGPSTRTWGART